MTGKLIPRPFLMVPFRRKAFGDIEVGDYLCMPHGSAHPVFVRVRMDGDKKVVYCREESAKGFAMEALWSEPLELVVIEQTPEGVDSTAGRSRREEAWR